MSIYFPSITILLTLIQFYQCIETIKLDIDTNEQQDSTEAFILCDPKIKHLKNYCQNKGICYSLIDKNKSNKTKKDNSSMDIYCSCPDEYTGTHCEIKIDLKFEKEEKLVTKSINYELLDQNSQIELNKNDKIDSKSSYKECLPIYKCLNGGTCIVDPIVGPKCLCKPEYTGLNCARSNRKCPPMTDCKLKCDFGYKLNGNNCETCRCNCVNEDNYFEEIRNTLKMANDKRNPDTINFCRKPCKLGYTKDENNCFKCQCLEETLSKSELIKTFANSQQPPDSKLVNKNNEELCQYIKCKSNEICKYLDKNYYKCPEDQVDCKKYDKMNKFPMCITTALNEPCLESVSAGSCDKRIERFYFDIVEKKCKKFYYSGCGGNRNSFISNEECSVICMKENVLPPLINNTSLTINAIKPILNTIVSKIQHRSTTTTTRTASTTTTLLTTTTKPPTTTTTTTITITSEKELKKETQANLIAKKEPVSEFKTISIPTANLNPFEINFNETRLPLIALDVPSTCQWVCDLNCPFGYQMNHRTKCYKCECINLNMTECGVPCFLEGTHSCLHSLRANSRPKCVCNQDYDGVYCQIFKKSFNFSARIEKSVKLTTDLSNEIKLDLSRKVSKILDLGLNHVVVNELKSNLNDESLYLKFALYAPEFTNASYFYSLVDTVNTLLNHRNITLKIMNQDYVLYTNCDKNEELFLMDLNDNYLFKSNRLKYMIEDLKQDIVNAYQFPLESINLVKIKFDPFVQLEVLIRNNANDPEFCKKAYILQNDIRSKSFRPISIEAKTSFQISSITSTTIMTQTESDEKRLIDENYLEPLNQENIFLSRNNPDLKSINNLSTSLFLNHSIAYLSVLISSFFIIIFLVSLVIITQLRRRQSKKITTKFDDNDSQLTLDNNDKKLPEFQGYFMPNYNTLTANDRAPSPIRSSIQKLNLISY